jgi:hypothetical protein
VKLQTIIKERLKMNMTEIKTIAKGHGIKCGKRNKTELIRAMQCQERNPECFNTGQVDICGQDQCLWRADCR